MFKTFALSAIIAAANAIEVEAQWWDAEPAAAVGAGYDGYGAGYGAGYDGYGAGYDGYGAGYGTGYDGYGAGYGTGYGDGYGAGYGSDLDTGYGRAGFGADKSGLGRIQELSDSFNSGYGVNGYGDAAYAGDSYGATGYGDQYGAGYGAGYGTGYDGYGATGYGQEAAVAEVKAPEKEVGTGLLGGLDSGLHRGGLMKGSLLGGSRGSRISGGSLGIGGDSLTSSLTGMRGYGGTVRSGLTDSIGSFGETAKATLSTEGKDVRGAALSRSKRSKGAAQIVDAEGEAGYEGPSGLEDIGSLSTGGLATADAESDLFVDGTFGTFGGFDQIGIQDGIAAHGTVDYAGYGGHGGHAHHASHAGHNAYGATGLTGARGFLGLGYDSTDYGYGNDNYSYGTDYGYGDSYGNNYNSGYGSYGTGYDTDYGYGAGYGYDDTSYGSSYGAGSYGTATGKAHSFW